MSSDGNGGGRWWRMYCCYRGGNNKQGMRRSLLLGLGLGQLISLDLAIMTLTASLISAQVDAPLTLSFTTHLWLAVVFGTFMLYRRQKLLVPWYWYVPLAFVDIHGNYLVNKAFQYTSMTSVTILDCWTVAWVMILTWIFLGAKYSPWQFVGTGICVAGLGLVLLSDAGVGGGGGSNPLLGDFLVIAGSLCFAMSNVGEEFCVKRKDTTEVLTMLGVFGMLLSGIELSVLEWKTLESTKFSAGLMLPYVGYAVAAFLFYVLVPFILKTHGATLFNLSLLTTDMWVVAFRVFIYKQTVDWLFYVAFALVVLGICIYSETGKDPDMTPPSENETTLGLEYTLVSDQDLRNAVDVDSTS